MMSRDGELRRIEERLEVVANWLIQGRCGDDAECAEARRLEIAHLQRRRAALLDDSARERAGDTAERAKQRPERAG
jgi:hypothetical protein